jgi:hypothetical protein
VRYVVPPRAFSLSFLVIYHLFILGIVEGVWEQGAGEKIRTKDTEKQLAAEDNCIIRNVIHMAKCN